MDHHQGFLDLLSHTLDRVLVQRPILARQFNQFRLPHSRAEGVVYVSVSGTGGKVFRGFSKVGDEGEDVSFGGERGGTIPLLQEVGD